jgi:hypothetical protein
MNIKLKAINRYCCQIAGQMRHTPDQRIAWGLALALFGLIMLGWNGTFYSSDGLSMYAVTDSLARYGRFDTEQIRWTGLQQGMVGPDGLLYSRKGLGTSILALPLTWAGLILPGLGPVHTSLLLMPLVTASTGALLYLAARRAFPGLPRSAAALATLAWGLGSLAWPYSKTFFSEPLAALTTIGALERLLAFQGATDEKPGQVKRTLRSADRSPPVGLHLRGEILAALGLGFWLGLGLLTRLAHAVALPVFGLAFLFVMWRRYGQGVAHWPLRPLLAFAAPIGVAAGLTLWYNWLRFGDPLTSGYLPEEAFNAIWWQGLLGLSVSPGRGLLWYLPWLILVGLAIPRAWRLAPVATAVAGGTCLLYFLLYAKWHMWHGGYCWGPRFLVPVLPLLGWLAVPAAARWRRLFTALATLAAAVNLIGVAWDFDPHQDALIQTGLRLFHPRTYFDPQYAQIPGMLRLGSFQTLDVMWVTEGRFQPTLALLALVLAAVGVTGGLSIALGKSIRLPGASGERVVNNLWWAMFLIALTTYAFLWGAGAAQPAGYRRVAQAITAHSPPGTMIWHNDHWNITTFLNLYRGQVDILGLLETQDTLSPEAAERLAPLAASPQPVWVISQGPVGTADVLDRTASQHRGMVDEVGVATSLSWSARPPQETEALKALFYFDSPDWRVQPLDATLGPDGRPLIRLAEAGVSPGAKAGDVIAVRLAWEALEPVTEAYRVFVQLIGPDGAPLALQVGPAQNGLAPTPTWGTGQAVTDVHAFRLRADVPPGNYEFLVGLWQAIDSTRLPTTDGRDAVTIGPISVQ